MPCLKGKIAIITGASSGIGAATAVHFADLGAILSITGRNAENLQHTLANCKKPESGDHLAIIGDLSNEEDVKKIVEETVDKFGKIDVLVNNAGILELGSIRNTSLEQYDKVMNLNISWHPLLPKIAEVYKEEKTTTRNVWNNGLRSFFVLSHLN
ncbi:uncharacterized oxidoreductase TM_0325-like isoform X1 [Artemia franciscana]|uniref:uncharacterized oxidoreductase TM_0325-like isoform X1 n=1 Tax=Artemia franciscana TaxID=6661 RepID=UPI0032D9F460